MALRFDLPAPPVDDSTLRLSLERQVDTVPTVVVVDDAGREVRRFVGFDRAAWRELLAGVEVDWERYPETRPGCGSRTHDPDVADRIVTNGLTSRRIEIAEADDPFEFLFDQGLTDGLPVVPPTPERVARMLAGTSRRPDEKVATVPPNMGSATVEKVAINAVMAGCRPEYFPVVIAAVEAVCTDRFNIHGVLATTHFVTPVLIVNGPIRDRIGMNYGVNALGQGNRANATIGRAVQLVIRNVGGGRPGEIDRACLGQPGKLTFCFAEWEERSQWPPFHVDRGYRANQSTVSVYAGYGPTGIIDQRARTAHDLATTYGLTVGAASSPRQRSYGDVVIVVPPEHVDTFARDGWTKAQVRDRVQAASDGKFTSTEAIHLVVAGGEAGKFAALIDNWAGGTGSLITTVEVTP